MMDGFLVTGDKKSSATFILYIGVKIFTLRFAPGIQICSGRGWPSADQSIAFATAARILVNHHFPRATRCSRRRPKMRACVPLNPSSSCSLVVIILFQLRHHFRREGGTKAVQAENYLKKVLGGTLKKKTEDRRRLTQFDHITDLQRKVRAVQQVFWIQRRAFALARDDDLLRFVRADIVRRRDGLRQRQSRDPRHARVLHLPDNRDARRLRSRLRLLLLQRHVLPRQKSVLRLQPRRGTRRATAHNQGEK